MVVVTRGSTARNAWRALSTPASTMIAAPDMVATTTGRMPKAARPMAPRKMTQALRAWSRDGSSFADHSIRTTSPLTFRELMSSGCPWTRSTSPACRRISVSRDGMLRRASLDLAA